MFRHTDAGNDKLAVAWSENTLRFDIAPASGDPACNVLMSAELTSVKVDEFDKLLKGMLAFRQRLAAKQRGQS